MIDVQEHLFIATDKSSSYSTDNATKPHPPTYITFDAPAVLLDHTPSPYELAKVLFRAGTSDVH